MRLQPAFLSHATPYAILRKWLNKLNGSFLTDDYDYRSSVDLGKWNWWILTYCWNRSAFRLCMEACERIGSHHMTTSSINAHQFVRSARDNLKFAKYDKLWIFNITQLRCSRLAQHIGYSVIGNCVTDPKWTFFATELSEDMWENERISPWENGNITFEHGIRYW